MDRIWELILINQEFLCRTLSFNWRSCNERLNIERNILLDTTFWRKKLVGDYVIAQRQPDFSYILVTDKSIIFINVTF